MVLGEAVTINPSTGFKIYIGSWSGKSSFNGYIGFVNVYEDTFEPADIFEQYVKARGESAHVLAKAVNVTQNYVVFEVYGKDVIVPPASDVTIEGVSLRPVKVGDSFNHTSLSIDLYAKKSFNGTLILNTYYFSTLQHVEIREGYNHIERIFPNKIDSKLIGIAVGQKMEILLLGEEGELLANTVVASTVLEGIRLSYILVLIILLSLLYLYTTYRENKSIS
jgi:hypothetical protein